jgi:glycogen debranching enzyme
VTRKPPPDLFIGDDYYILASSVAADLPKLVLKHDEAFMVADRHGDLPNLPRSELGFYVEGTRFLRQLELLMLGERPLALYADVSEDALQASVELANPDVTISPRVILPGRSVRISRRLCVYDRTLYQLAVIESFVHDPLDLILTFRFAADFVDMFEVRGHPRERRGTLLPPELDSTEVRLAYRGLDDVVRTTALVFDPAPALLRADLAEYPLLLGPRERVQITLSVNALTHPGPAVRPLPFTDALPRRRIPIERLEEQATAVHAPHDLFDRWIARSRRDLHLLVTETRDGFVPYAGVPWYVAPFGRDALITSLQVLPFEPEIARGTLRFLARHIGTVDDSFTDQEPGKILHEYRRGEMAACREIPFIPYYGSVDATPLYLMLLAEHFRWTADLDLVRELWPAAEAALRWMTRAADAQGSGYLVYRRRSPRGLANQGWKDAWDAVMHASGELADPPIALAEVQGYQYAALRGMAQLATAVGAPELASSLTARSGRLRERFEADFWLPDEAFYAMALDGTGRPCRVVSSNPGHLLWTQLPGEARARAVAARLMDDDMFTGWGVRTLGSRTRAYNPMSYHTGSVWPHDTAIAAVGMRRYGLVEPFLTLTTALFEAVLHFEALRMPELFCGFPRMPGYGPTRYPVACSPQAWSAGVVFQLLAAVLGLSASAEQNQLTLERPRLPGWLTSVELENLRLGPSRLTFRALRGHNSTAVELLAREGDTELVVRP